jgi:hypothetical protein
MNGNKFAIACALAVTASSPGARADALAPGPGRDPAAEVRAVFSAKCASCHGPQVSRPPGRFGYVLDLQRVADNREMVVPSSPDESELWLLVRNNDMPPPDSSTGPLTDKQKETIRAWIAAGAPSGAASSTWRPAAPRRPEDGEAAPLPAPSAPPAMFGRARLGWFGKFHLLVLHFPIALLAAAVAGELWGALRGAQGPSQVVRFCLCLGAAAAVPTVALGWLYAIGGHGAKSPGMLALHRWLGTVAGLWAVAAAVLGEWDARRGMRRWPVRVMVPVGALLVALAAHFGGALAHGATFFDW